MATQLRIKDGKKWEFKGKIVVDSNGRLVKGKSENWELVGYTGRKPKGKLVILEGVTEIGGWAFKGCTGLTSVEIPSSVTEIYQNAFEDCTGLASVVIPAGVTRIDAWAFLGCTGLKSIEIPSSVTRIGGGAFKGCTGLTSVEIPPSVTKIGRHAFYDCTGLTSIEIPLSVTEIGGGRLMVVCIFRKFMWMRIIASIHQKMGYYSIRKE